MTVEGAAYDPWYRLGVEGYVLYVDIGPRKLEALLPKSESEIVLVTVGKRGYGRTHSRGLD